jgi:hypothetical protein
MLLSQAPAQAWQQPLHHHHQPRAVARLSSGFHSSHIHPHQALYALLSEGTQGVERRGRSTRMFFRSSITIVPFHFQISLFLFFALLCGLCSQLGFPPLKELPVDVGG